MQTGCEDGLFCRFQGPDPLCHIPYEYHQEPRPPVSGTPRVRDPHPLIITTCTTGGGDDRRQPNAANFKKVTPPFSCICICLSSFKTNEFIKPRRYEKL
ncbi:hypothetical protein EYF80_045808 [Liparis tanakae]|uniref:Uncharacterized protein n=1 Tax=Liparis tanakae TaxID=230148 RepID=A0A4Z2FT00_9TELE|nr:hypothetical protein EYF80_045808 [Liparis tanakae]